MKARASLAPPPGALYLQSMRVILLILLAGVLAAVWLAGCRTNESPEGQVKDAEILAAVKARLATDLGVQTITNVSVNVTNGVVTLSGQVDSAESRTKAGAAAAAVAHVRSVVNNLQVAAQP